jgi:hypothetical protein
MCLVHSAHRPLGANKAHAVCVLQPFCAPAGDQLDGLKLSADQRLLAYSLEMHTGQQQAAEQYCCVVRDIHAGEGEGQHA